MAGSPSQHVPSRNLVALALGAILAVSLVHHVHWIARGRDRLVGRVAYEDAFYYFQTARAVAQGQGSVSSGGIAHNGYHPLWMWFCAGFFRLIGPEGLTAVRAILAAGVAIGFLAVLVLYRALRVLGVSPGVALIAVGCYWLNPWMLSLTICGLEAPLQGLLVALLVYWVLPAPGLREGFAPAADMVFFARRWAWYGALGLLFALVFLVRTDNAFLLGAVGVWLAWRVRRDRVALGWLVGAVGLSLALVSPWLLWNLRHFGSVVQGSAGALPYVREIAYYESHPGAGRADFMRWRLGLLAGYFPAVLYYTGLGSLWYLLVLGVGGGMALSRGRMALRWLGGALVSLWPLAFATVCLGVAHKFVRLATREWYYVTSDVLLALALGILLHYLAGVAGRSRGAFLVAITIGLAGLLGWKNVRAWRQRSHDRPEYALEIVQAIDNLALIEPDEPVGCTDSGIVGFFADRAIVNLDGVVNPDAARHIRQGRLLDYTRAMGIRYFIITPRMYNEKVWGEGVRRRLAPFPPMTGQGYRYVGDLD